MAVFVVYDDTGKIVRYGTCQRDQIALQGKDLNVMEVDKLEYAIDSKYFVKDGELKLKT